MGKERCEISIMTKEKKMADFRGLREPYGLGRGGVRGLRGDFHWKTWYCKEKNERRGRGREDYTNRKKTKNRKRGSRLSSKWGRVTTGGPTV